MGTRSFRHRVNPARSRGFSLVELLVAVAIGVFLLAGTLTMFQQTRTQYRSIEAVARLQESARFAMSILENDLRLAGYWGKHAQSRSVDGDAGVVDLDLCDADYDPTVANLQTYVAGGGTMTLDCATDVRANTDVLIVRRASLDPVAPEISGDTADPPAEPDLEDKVLYVQTGYVGSLAFEGDEVPLPWSSDSSDTHLLITNAYYVQDSSESDPELPSLHRISLAPGPEARDEEVVPGIEDFAVEFGIDNDLNGTVDAWTTDPTTLASRPPVAARVTVVARAEQREPGVEPDGFRRFTITKTVYLRNQRR